MMTWAIRLPLDRPSWQLPQRRAPGVIIIDGAKPPPVMGKQPVTPDPVSGHRLQASPLNISQPIAPGAQADFGRREFSTRMRADGSKARLRETIKHKTNGSQRTSGHIFDELYNDRLQKQVQTDP